MQRLIEKVWIDDTHVYAQTTDGIVAGYCFVDWEKLKKASKSQREDFYLTYSGIHWPQIDEDLSFEGMFHNAGLCSRTEKEDSVCYIPPSERFKRST